ncbi:MAG: acyl-CoA dehydrogenase [Burkholderiales bacterium]
MPEFLSPELTALRDRVASLASDTLAALRDDAALSPADRAARVRAASKAAGIYHLTQAADTPELTLLVVRETLALHNTGHLAGVLGAGAGVLAGVGEPLRSSHLLPVLAGDKRAGFAFTESADAPRPTWAVSEGDTLVVTGSKSYVTGGAHADFLAALVDVEGQGPSMVIIDTDAPGVSITRHFGSMDGSQHAAFRFEAVRVPRHHAIGAPGDGRGRALAKISAVRRAVAADCVGSAGWIIGLLAEELRRPRRSGLVLAASERIRLRYGDLRIRAYAARSAVYRAARLADAGHDAVNETIAAKVLASEIAGEIADAAIQLLGGEALVTGHPLEAQFRRLRSLRLAEGETDTLRVNLARGHLDLGKGSL